MIMEDDCRVVFRANGKVICIVENKLSQGFGNDDYAVYLDFQNDEQIDNLISALNLLKGQGVNDYKDNCG